MAVDLNIQFESDETEDKSEPAVDFDAASEEALMHAVHAWQAMRARFAEVDPERLAPPSRMAYVRLMGRIGLWADARCFGEPIDPNDDSVS